MGKKGGRRKSGGIHQIDFVNKLQIIPFNKRTTDEIRPAGSSRCMTLLYTVMLSHNVASQVETMYASQPSVNTCFLFLKFTFVNLWDINT